MAVSVTPKVWRIILIITNKSQGRKTCQVSKLKNTIGRWQQRVAKEVRASVEERPFNSEKKKRLIF